MKLSSPLTPRKYTILNWNFVFSVHDIFQERNTGIKQDMPVHWILLHSMSSTFALRVDTVMGTV